MRIFYLFRLVGKNVNGKRLVGIIFRRERQSAASGRVGVKSLAKQHHVAVAWAGDHEYINRTAHLKTYQDPTGIKAM